MLLALFLSPLSLSIFFQTFSSVYFESCNRKCPTQIPSGLTPRSCPARSRNWHEFRIREWKKRGEWTTRRLDYGWCVDFHFLWLCPVVAVGVWLLLGLSFCVGGSPRGTVFGTTAAPSMLFQKYLQCRVCCHHSFWLFIVFSFSHVWTNSTKPKKKE